MHRAERLARVRFVSNRLNNRPGLGAAHGRVGVRLETFGRRVKSSKLAAT
ncbi:MAG TPA: hypothetical protein VGO96_17085 [Pyrinomonadaceae bacterium]|nr:hypothetical protein [Pyrinomonadaceae bacterium]